MADHPGEAFALTDLVRALKLSRATCHALLTGLVEVGYLYRTSDKTYVLGPALAIIGRTAAEHFSPLQVAKPEMRTLADEFDVVCGAYFLEGDYLHLRDRAASLSHVGYPVPLGTRMKLRSAQAPVFFAFAPQEAEDWLKRATPPPAADKRDLMFKCMEFTREHGFVAMVRNPAMPFSEASADRLLGTETDELPVVPVAELEPATGYSLSAMMSPIFDARGKVDFALLLAGFNYGMTGEQIMAVGAKLRAASERITRFLGGNPRPA
jgi:DNA-binding IclR family transcriptional regulator